LKPASDSTSKQKRKKFSTTDEDEQSESTSRKRVKRSPGKNLLKQDRNDIFTPLNFKMQADKDGKMMAYVEFDIDQLEGLLAYSKSLKE